MSSLFFSDHKRSLNCIACLTGPSLPGNPLCKVCFGEYCGAPAGTVLELWAYQKREEAMAKLGQKDLGWTAPTSHIVAAKHSRFGFWTECECGWRTATYTRSSPAPLGSDYQATVEHWFMVGAMGQEEYAAACRVLGWAK